PHLGCEEPKIGKAAFLEGLPPGLVGVAACEVQIPGSERAGALACASPSTLSPIRGRCPFRRLDASKPGPGTNVPPCRRLLATKNVSLNQAFVLLRGLPGDRAGKTCG